MVEANCATNIPREGALMSTQAAKTPGEIDEVAAQLPKPHKTGLEGFDVRGEGFSEKLVDAIEMIGEEKAAGFGHGGPSAVTAGMRYLHSSRTIHQLVMDRNRAVGIYLAVASLLMTASGALYHANPQGDLIIPLTAIQRWCLPLTFGTLAVLAVFVGLLLIRTRAGLIYEVAKMNALLGLPLGRVSRVNVLSIHFILHAMISVAGGMASALFAAYMLTLAGDGHEQVALPSTLIGMAVAVALMILYVITVTYVTSDRRLQRDQEK
jgi:hypothetical protein